MACPRVPRSNIEEAPRAASLRISAERQIELTSAVEGVWITSSQSGDTVAWGTELRLAKGRAEESSVFQAMGTPARYDPRATGSYAISGAGELVLALGWPGGSRGERFTFIRRTGWPGQSRDTTECVIRDAYLAADRPGTYVREESSSSSQPPAPKKTRRIRVTLELSPPAEALVAAPRSCTLRLGITGEIVVDGTAGTRANEARRLACHAEPPRDDGLVPIIIDDFRRPRGGGSYEVIPFLSGARAPDGRSTELSDLVERAIDKELYVDPRTPQVVLRGALVQGIHSSWWKRE